MAAIECCKHKFCYKCIHYWATEKKNVCPMCKQKFNHIKKWSVTHIPDKNVDQSMWIRRCRVCRQDISRGQPYLQCEDNHGRFYRVYNGCYAHLNCAKSESLLDPNTGQYLCKQSNIKRCPDCFKIFAHNVITISGVSNKFWNDFGCPFCKDSSYVEGIHTNQLNRYLIYKALSIINYNEYIMSQAMKKVEAAE